MSEAKVDASTVEFHTVPEDLPVSLLDCRAAFENLTEEEKLYAHHVSQASWAGTKIVLHQTSTESPVIFDLLQAVFSNEDADSLASKASAAGVSETEFKHFLEYAAQFYGNSGNYLSFGDSKFIPRLSKDKFRAVVESSAAASSEADGARVAKLLSSCIDAVYSLNPSELSLGFPDQGVSTYYSPNVTKADMEAVGKVMDEAGISPYNTRLFKHVRDDGSVDHFELRLAAAVEGTVSEHKLADGSTLRVVRGDYDGALADVATHLSKAKDHAANENQKKMMSAYVASFSNGSIDDHKEAQMHWIRDVGPVVESNIGFIESYRDPFGVRGEFEGFAAVVNKDTSRKFGELVSRAPEFLPLLPWPREYEKDTFSKPDFTSLEVISFAGSGIPAGINIPNYDDIRQNHGFKNVSLGNVLTAYSPGTKITFLNESDQKVYETLKVPSFEVQVGCHELLGHGSGKLFVESADGKLNFSKDTINPVTGKPIESWYKGGATYDSVFQAMGSSYEECRAECVGILLSANKELLKVFGYDGDSAGDITYVNWLNMARAGVLGLEFYSPDQKKWRQAHMQARYAILRVLLAAGQGFVTLAGDSYDNMVVELDRTKIDSVGVPAIKDFLGKLQVYKATADIGAARELYEGVTSVSDDHLKLRDVVLAKKQPRKVFVQVHTSIQGDGTVALEEFEPTPKGVIQSFVRRFGTSYRACAE